MRQVVGVRKDFDLDRIGVTNGEVEASSNLCRQNGTPALDLQISHCFVADTPVAGDNFFTIGVQ